MASARQLAANRANSKKSTGPRTEIGKNASRRNAIRHGLTGQILLRTPEQDAAYNTYRARLYPDLAPGDAVEYDFAERIIYDSWRVHRATAIEHNLYALADPAFETGDDARDEAMNEAHTFQVNAQSINLLSLYQQRLQRGIHKDLEMLRRMQKERRAAERSARRQPEEFIAPETRQPMQVIEFEAAPAVIGSVCSDPPSPASPPSPAGRTNPENMAA